MKQDKYAIVDTSKFPIVVVTFTGKKATLENFTLYLEELISIYEVQEKLALIFDATTAIVPGLKFQKLQADWLKENESLMKNYCIGTAYVIPNFLIRGVLNIIFSFQRQPVPYTICLALEEANKWIEEKF